MNINVLRTNVLRQDNITIYYYIITIIIPCVGKIRIATPVIGMCNINTLCLPYMYE